MQSQQPVKLYDKVIASGHNAGFQGELDHALRFSSYNAQLPVVLLFPLVLLCPEVMKVSQSQLHTCVGRQGCRLSQISCLVLP